MSLDKTAFYAYVKLQHEGEDGFAQFWPEVQGHTLYLRDQMGVESHELGFLDLLGCKVSEASAWQMRDLKDEHRHILILELKTESSFGHTVYWMSVDSAQAAVEWMQLIRLQVEHDDTAKTALLAAAVPVATAIPVVYGAVVSFLAPQSNIDDDAASSYFEAPEGWIPTVVRQGQVVYCESKWWNKNGDVSSDPDMLPLPPLPMMKSTGIRYTQKSHDESMETIDIDDLFRDMIGTVKVVSTVHKEYCALISRYKSVLGTLGKELGFTSTKYEEPNLADIVAQFRATLMDHGVKLWKCIKLDTSTLMQGPSPSPPPSRSILLRFSVLARARLALGVTLALRTNRTRRTFNTALSGIALPQVYSA